MVVPCNISGPVINPIQLFQQKLLFFQPVQFVNTYMLLSLINNIIFTL